MADAKNTKLAALVAYLKHTRSNHEQSIVASDPIIAAHIKDISEWIDELEPSVTASQSAGQEANSGARTRIAALLDAWANRRGVNPEVIHGLDGEHDLLTSDLRALLAAPVNDGERALDLLETLFEAYENGPACYEDPSEQAGFVGNAVRLDDETFRACADLLNLHRPRDSERAADAPQVANESDDLFNHWYETKFRPAMERGPFDKYVARQAWFAALTSPAKVTVDNPDELTPPEFLASHLIDAWVAAHGKQIPWKKAIEISAIVTKMTDEERDRLLTLGDE